MKLLYHTGNSFCVKFAPEEILSLMKLGYVFGYESKLGGVWHYVKAAESEIATALQSLKKITTWDDIPDREIDLWPYWSLKKDGEIAAIINPVHHYKSKNGVQIWWEFDADLVWGDRPLTAAALGLIELVKHGPVAVQTSFMDTQMVTQKEA
jgi:hypothetical protein